MKYCRKTIAAVAFYISGATLSHAQTLSAPAEGLSRQIEALRSAMTSYRAYSDNRVEQIEDKLNVQTDCFNKKKIYWPNHPKADGKSCVSHKDISTKTAKFCKETKVTWPLNEDQKRLTYNPGKGCTQTAPLMKEGEQASLRQSVGGCRKPETDGRSGSATFKCVNGSIRLIKRSASCVVARTNMGECK